MTFSNTFSESQQKAYDAANKGENIFISGSAGNGKSFLTKALTTPSTVVVAPTGIAALNVGGSTCHKVFGLPLGIPTGGDLFLTPKCMSIFKNSVDRIIISEIGMVRTDMLELINTRLQKVRGNKKPFGGIQMILEGDFYQIEPIVKASEEEMFFERYPSKFCFKAKCWDFKTYNLTQPQRHPNINHYNLLNRLRVGDKSAVHELMKISKPYVNSEDVLHICSYKEDAATVNNHHYERINAKEHTFAGVKSGYVSLNDKPVGMEVKLKVGCKVVICANSQDGEYVNGDQGTITNILKNSVEVELLDGREVVVQRHTWTDFKYSSEGKRLIREPSGLFNQIPLILGYAISSHKCQGMTLSNTALDMGRGCFAHGQLYVAASRVRDLSDQSFVTPVSESDLIVRDEVKAFYGN